MLNSHLSATDFRKLFRPCIYFWYRQTTCLYIGCSMGGFRRLFNPHIVVDTYEPIQDIDHFEFIWFDTITQQQLRIVEQSHIQRLNPIYNNSNLSKAVLSQIADNTAEKK